MRGGEGLMTTEIGTAHIGRGSGIYKKSSLLETILPWKMFC
jgi:hypothetical protein